MQIRILLQKRRAVSLNKQDIIIRPISTEDIDGVQNFLLFQLKELFAQLL